MRPLKELNKYRDRAWERAMGGEGDDFGGCFKVPSDKAGITLAIIASNMAGWDHLSVSSEWRCPSWAEMEKVKRLFFRDDETAMQLHVPPADHINNHPHCLHLWRPHEADIPLPPSEFV